MRLPQGPAGPEIGHGPVNVPFPILDLDLPVVIAPRIALEGVQGQPVAFGDLVEGAPDAFGLGPDDISVEQLKQMRDRKEDFVLVDVRNPDEFQISVIDGSVKLPLPDLPQRFKELPKDKLIVLHCKMGSRSMRALKFLRQQGYGKLKNVAGGINAWAERIDPNVPQY